MASFTVSAAPWPVGQSVSAYPAEAWPDARSAPSGAATATATVGSAGTASFVGLADNRRYVAYALGRGVQFRTASSGLQSPVAVPDRERLKAVEDATSRVLVWSAAASAYSHPDWWSDSTYPREFRGPTDPSSVTGITLVFGDVWIPS